LEIQWVTREGEWGGGRNSRGRVKKGTGISRVKEREGRKGTAEGRGGSRLAFENTRGGVEGGLITKEKKEKKEGGGRPSSKKGRPKNEFLDTRPSRRSREGGPEVTFGKKGGKRLRSEGKEGLGIHGRGQSITSPVEKRGGRSGTQAAGGAQGELGNRL